MKKTALDWFFEKIKSNFEHDGELFESVCFTFAIAKQKEKKEHTRKFSKSQKLDVAKEKMKLIQAIDYIIQNK